VAVPKELSGYVILKDTASRVPTTQHEFIFLYNNIIGNNTMFKVLEKTQECASHILRKLSSASTLLIKTAGIATLFSASTINLEAQTNYNFTEQNFTIVSAAGAN
jgi:hypothetical protein